MAVSNERERKMETIEDIPAISAGIQIRERFRETLEEIADQKTTEEIDAANKAILDDYGAHDFEGAYDIMIRKAREVLGRSNAEMSRAHRMKNKAPSVRATCAKGRTVSVGSGDLLAFFHYGKSKNKYHGKADYGIPLYAARHDSR